VTPSGCPRITDAIAAFDCEVHEVISAGTHLIHVGRVRDVRTTDGTPLVHSARTYCRPEPVEPSTFPDFPDARPTYTSRKQD
jgi:flavin reductase